ncbi:hypothetical protein GF325_05065 [Candidatus Bathyarchaeota archaeon]|nr:hypothetical protein [Candidatus Bathyarchaeota archaeon]
MVERRINEFLSLKLEGRTTVIYIKSKRFRICKQLILNIPLEKARSSIDEYASIDELAEHFRNTELVRVDIDPELEFWAHHSNLQAWYENGYDTNLLEARLAFPLLKALVKAGDPAAENAYIAEIRRRVLAGHPAVIISMHEQRIFEDIEDQVELLETAGRMLLNEGFFDAGIDLLLDAGVEVTLLHDELVQCGNMALARFKLWEALRCYNITRTPIESKKQEILEVGVNLLKKGDLVDGIFALELFDIDPCKYHDLLIDGGKQALKNGKISNGLIMLGLARQNVEDHEEYLMECARKHLNQGEFHYGISLLSMLDQINHDRISFIRDAIDGALSYGDINDALHMINISGGTIHDYRDSFVKAGRNMLCKGFLNIAAQLFLCVDVDVRDYPDDLMTCGFIAINSGDIGYAYRSFYLAGLDIRDIPQKEIERCAIQAIEKGNLQHAFTAFELAGIKPIERRNPLIQVLIDILHEQNYTTSHDIQSALFILKMLDEDAVTFKEHFIAFGKRMIRQGNIVEGVIAFNKIGMNVADFKDDIIHSAKKHLLRGNTSEALIGFAFVGEEIMNYRREMIWGYHESLINGDLHAAYFLSQLADISIEHSLSPWLQQARSFLASGYISRMLLCLDITKTAMKPFKEGITRSIRMTIIKGYLHLAQKGLSLIGLTLSDFKEDLLYSAEIFLKENNIKAAISLFEQAGVEKAEIQGKVKKREIHVINAMQYQRLDILHKYIGNENNDFSPLNRNLIHSRFNMLNFHDVLSFATKWKMDLSEYSKKINLLIKSLLFTSNQEGMFRILKEASFKLHDFIDPCEITRLHLVEKDYYRLKSLIDNCKLDHPVSDDEWKSMARYYLWSLFYYNTLKEMMGMDVVSLEDIQEDLLDSAIDLLDLFRISEASYIFTINGTIPEGFHDLIRNRIEGALLTFGIPEYEIGIGLIGENIHLDKSTLQAVILRFLVIGNLGAASEFIGRASFDITSYKGLIVSLLAYDLYNRDSWETLSGILPRIGITSVREIDNIEGLDQDTKLIETLKTRMMEQERKNEL